MPGEKRPREFGIPIQLHTRPPHGVSDPTQKQLDTPIVSRGKTYTSWSYADPSSSSSNPPATTSNPVDEAVPPVNTEEPPRKKHKRKFEAFNVNELPDSMFGPTLKPKSIPSFRSYPSVQSAHGMIPYGTSWDGVVVDNNRSDNPSDREIALEAKREKERVRLRAEAAAAKKNKKPGPKPRKSNNVTASASRNASPNPEIETPTSTVSPTVTFAPPNGMKRTRSAGGGIGPISAVLANSLGAGTVNVSSPLKSVTGPNTPEDLEAESAIPEVEPRRGRSRLSGDSNSPPDQRAGRKANSHSPTSSTIALVPVSSPITHPSITNKPVSRNASIGGNAMRRVVSASNIGKKATNGSPLAPEGARERSRREVILPGRLRDYDVKAGTPT
jgi:hypothetical protein